MESLRVGAVSLVGLVALLVIRQWKPEWAVFLRVGMAVVLLSAVVTMVSSVVSFVGEMSGEALPEGMWQLLLKALGIAFLTEVAAGICRDSGEGSVATWVEMAGKLELLLLSLPLVKEVLAMAMELLGG